MFSELLDTPCVKQILKIRKYFFVLICKTAKLGPARRAWSRKKNVVVRDELSE